MKASLQRCVIQLIGEINKICNDPDFGALEAFLGVVGNQAFYPKFRDIITKYRNAITTRDESSVIFGSFAGLGVANTELVNVKKEKFVKMWEEMVPANKAAIWDYFTIFLNKIDRIEKLDKSKSQ